LETFAFFVLFVLFVVKRLALKPAAFFTGILRSGIQLANNLH